MKLHHTVDHEPMCKIVESIEMNGLVPDVACAYKDLVPEEIRHLPVVWFAEGIWHGYELPCFEVESKSLDKSKLYPVLKDPNWWVYQGEIPSNNLTRIQ